MKSMTLHQRGGLHTLPMTDLVWLTIFVFPISWAVGFLFTFVISRWTDITVSMTELLTGLGLWYVGILAGWSAFTHIPLFVANGKTRRDAFVAWLTASVAMALVGAVIVAIAYFAERAAYHALDWTPKLGDEHLFTSGYQVHLVFIEYLLAFLVAAAIGGFVGMSVYRSKSFGWFAVIPGMILAAIAGVLERGNVRVMGFLQQDTFGVDGLGTAIQLIMIVLVAVAGAAMAFAVARDVPLRNR